MLTGATLKIRVERALSAVRGQMRHMDIDPKATSVLDMQRVFDDLARVGHDAGIWYNSISDKAAAKVAKEWEKWKTR